VHHDAVSHDVAPQRRSASKLGLCFVAGDFEDLDAVAGDRLCIAPPLLDCGCPGVVVFVDFVGPHDDGVEITVLVGLASCERSEHDHADRWERESGCGSPDAIQRGVT
jgi:hypothetical protein